MAVEPEICVLSNGRITANIANWGATITSLLVPDAQGDLADVVLGFDTLEPYLKGMAPYFGCIDCRVANRIKDGKFDLNGVEYSLPINNGPNSLHGGLKGFDKVVWDVVERKDGEYPSITFQYESKDGEEGYPGDVTIRATYSLPEATTLRLDMEAIPANKATPISLAQHTYWNLAGHNSGTILDHSIQIWAKHITPVNENTIPTGEIMSVQDTPFDFTTEHRIGDRINDVPGGYDHNYVLDSGDEKNGLKRSKAKGLVELTDSGPLDRCAWHAVLYRQLCEWHHGQRRSCLREACRSMLGNPGVPQCHQPDQFPVCGGAAWCEV
ncbi:hypothetical protein ZWY2020_016942 [Hordeum vulgare]|nr:hypothetical protein ZWY2020_016942 [Hordeum vulgare]